MNIAYIFLLLFSFTFASNLDSWLKQNSSLIKGKKFNISFNYAFKEKYSNSKVQNMGNGDYIYVDSDSSIIRLDNRITLCYGNNWEIIDIVTEQKFLQGKDEILQEYMDRILSIFFSDDYKVIKLMRNSYLLSLNDYFFIMKIIFNSEENEISKIRFDQNSYEIEITNLSITLLDSIPFQYQNNWENFEIFNLR